MKYNESPKHSFKAGTGGVEAYRLLKLVSGTVQHNTATNTDDPIGSSHYAAAEGDGVMVHLLNGPGSRPLEAAGAINAGDEVFAADDGKVQALPASAGDYRRIGLALSAATGDGSVLEVLPYNYYSSETVS